MKVFCIIISFCFTTLLSNESNSQIINNTFPDSTKEKPTQYRRGTELNENQQSYEEKYFGKNLNEEKRSLFPLRGGTGVWTELNPKVPRVDYLGIHFVNKDTGWAVGDLGALIKTTDGGNSWRVSETNTTTPILKVRSFNGQIVIASGFNGLILRSTDGGETFTQVTSGVTGDLWGLQMINDTRGWACGNANSLTKTTDGGQTWQRIFTPGYTSDYWWIDFLTASYGFIAANGKVLRTIDGGNNWETIQAGDDFPLFSIDVIDSLHIAAAGYGGTSYRGKNIYSSDGGYTWINGGPLTFEAVNCIQYVNPDTGYLVMTNVSARKTTNRGQDWTTIQGISDNYELQFIGILPEELGYGAGTGLQINKADGNLDLWNKLIINDNFADVYFTSETTGYAAANRIIYKTTDSGESWFVLPNFPSNVFTSALNSLTFIDSVTGFAGGPPCRIVKTTDAGNSWYVTNRSGLTDTIGSINRILFINPTTGWAVTSRGGILKTTDSGENWFAQLNASISIGFYGIYFVDSLNGWTANSNARPYKTTNGGNNWDYQSNMEIFQSRDIYFTTQDTGWITSTLPIGLYSTTDYGINWMVVPDIVQPFNFGFFPNKNHWLVNGFGTYLYETTNGGQTFIDISNEVPAGFNRFFAPVDYLGYAIGSLGLVLKYLDTSYVPVELISFTGAIENHRIILVWQTASELNNKGFHVEKSFDKEKWLSIGFVEGFGTITNINYYSFIDNEITSDIQFYRLKQIDYDGSFEYSKIIEVEIGAPSEFSLSQNYPNPFNPTTKINFSLRSDSKVTLKIFDVLGKEITTLTNENMTAGYYNIEFNALGYASGVYFFQLRAEGINGRIFNSIKKMMLIK